MKINFRDELRNNRDSLLTHLIVQGLVDTLEKNSDVIMTDEYNKEGILNIDLHVNGVELNVKEFCDMWQKQVDESEKKLISKHVEENISRKIYDIEDLLSDLGERLKAEVDKRLEDWEKKE